MFGCLCILRIAKRINGNYLGKKKYEKRKKRGKSFFVLDDCNMKRTHITYVTLPVSYQIIVSPDQMHAYRHLMVSLRHRCAPLRFWSTLMT